MDLLASLFVIFFFKKKDDKREFLGPVLNPWMPLEVFHYLVVMAATWWSLYLTLPPLLSLSLSIKTASRGCGASEASTTL